MYSFDDAPSDAWLYDLYPLNLKSQLSTMDPEAVAPLPNPEPAFDFGFLQNLDNPIPVTLGNVPYAAGPSGDFSLSGNLLVNLQPSNAGCSNYDATVFLESFPFDGLAGSSNINMLYTAEELKATTVKPEDVSPVKNNGESLQRLASDSQYANADDALRARSYRLYESQRAAVELAASTQGQSAWAPSSSRSSPLKRSRMTEAHPVKIEAVESISAFSRRARAVVPLPARSPPITPNHFTYPQETSYNTSAGTSPATSVYELYRIDDSAFQDASDDDYKPISRKRRRRNNQSHEHRGKKTQLQIVLEDLGFTLDDIDRRDGLFYCPFDNCHQRTNSEGDLGRHLESSQHATHNYLCLDPHCLNVFAREDSMKRHHANNRGRAHRERHDRAVRELGMPFRVRRGDVEAARSDIRALAEAGRL
ncbi:hypothetical protein BKA70DRAFT_1278095 [Coprinopsis sp. MPI-PUGE-AT-0042]|nr:hypothetical protein BKA70DRAFT_1278095 [Coprinopsis sp. MPI-PUGE-AT-0042]